MKDPKIRTRLRDVLAELCPNEADIRRIVDDAGLKWQRIEKSSAINTWHSVLVVAETSGKAAALLDVVQQEYEHNQALQDACNAYGQSLGKTGKADSAPPVLATQFRLRLPTLLLGLLLFGGVAGGGWYWNFFNLNASESKAPSATTTTSVPYTSETQVEIMTITPVATSISSATQSMAVATAKKFSPTATATSIAIPTSIPTPTPQPTATSTPIPPPTYPCEAEILSPTGGDIVKRARAIPSSNGPLMPAIQAGTLVEVQGKFGESEIWYHIFDKSGREFGWLLSNYLRLSSSCPR